MELWDVYDKDCNKTGKVIKRGDKLNNGEYHLVINAWIVNDKGQFLITQRAENKTHPLMWECTGGSVLHGEDVLTAVKREVKEEVGIDVDIKKAKLIGKTLRYFKDKNDILFVYLFTNNTPIEKVKIQEEEVKDVMWASKEKIMELKQNGKFEANAFFDEALNI